MQQQFSHVTIFRISPDFACHTHFSSKCYLPGSAYIEVETPLIHSRIPELSIVSLANSWKVVSLFVAFAGKHSSGALKVSLSETMVSINSHKCRRILCSTLVQKIESLESISDSWC